MANQNVQDINPQETNKRARERERERKSENKRRDKTSSRYVPIVAYGKQTLHTEGSEREMYTIKFNRRYTIYI